jgi:hypothetical protein
MKRRIAGKSKAVRPDSTASVGEFRSTWRQSSELYAARWLTSDPIDDTEAALADDP